MRENGFVAISPPQHPRPLINYPLNGEGPQVMMVPISIVKLRNKRVSNKVEFYKKMKVIY